MIDTALNTDFSNIKFYSDTAIGRNRSTSVTVKFSDKIICGTKICDCVATNLKTMSNSK